MPDRARMSPGASAQSAVKVEGAALVGLAAMSYALVTIETIRTRRMGSIQAGEAASLS